MQLTWQKQSLAHPNTFAACVIKSRMTPAYGGLGSLAPTTGDIQTSTHLIFFHWGRGFEEEAPVGFLLPPPNLTVSTFASCSREGYENLCYQASVDLLRASLSRAIGLFVETKSHMARSSINSTSRQRIALNLES